MQIEILPKDCGGTEFLARPHRLHLGGQQAEGVDLLQFRLPAAWQGLAVALYIEHSDGTSPSAIPLSADSTVEVDRRFTAWPAGKWMLAATDGAGYAAYTRPGSYDVYEVIEANGSAEDPGPTLYEQFVARVLASANEAAAAAKSAASSESAAAASAAQARLAGSTAASGANSAGQAAAKAEAAAKRAESYAPTDGTVLSVNGKGGAVQLTAQEVGAVPAPASPAAGQLLRVLSVDAATGALTVDTTAGPDLSGYVRAEVLPSASSAGAVKIAPGFGLALHTDGTLMTSAATRAQLDAMRDAYAPLAPALLPYGVKKALAEFSSMASWTDPERAAAREALGVDSSGALAKLAARVSALEAGGSSAAQTGFAYDFTSLSGLSVSGTWNAESARLEF